MLERIKHESTVDVYGHVTVLRTQRNYMVQQEVRADCQQFLRIAVAAVTVFFRVIPCSSEVFLLNHFAYFRSNSHSSYVVNMDGSSLM